MAVFNVTNLMDMGTGSLRDAITMANASVGVPDIINFDSSLRGGTIELTSGELSITDALTINGLGANLLTVDGQMNGFRVFNIDNSVDSLIDVFINNLTITGGNPTDNGGGIRSLENLTVENSIISGNTLVGIPGSEDNFDGGGIDSRSGNLTIINSIISGNQIIGQKEDGDDTDGGGVSIRDGQLNVLNSTISGNEVTGDTPDGGGIYSLNSEMVVVESTISGNTVEGNDLGSGGGIYSRYGNVTLTNSTIANNSTDMTGEAGDGGGIFSRNGNLTVISSTISGNTAKGEGSTDGGGIYSRNGNLTVTNSTISYNSLDQEIVSSFAQGGGIYSNSGILTVANTTLVGNLAPVGGGLFNGGTANLTNIIIANSVTGVDCVNSGNLATNTNNLIKDGSCNPLKSGEPNLGPLQNNGGTTKTHALLSGSIAIDMGDNGGAVGLPFDQRGSGFPRIVNGTVDIGAYEVQQQPPASVPETSSLMGLVVFGIATLAIGQGKLRPQ